MLLELLGRHLAVAGRIEAEKLVARDAGFWNVISIYDPNGTKPKLPKARSVLYVPFDDIENEEMIHSGWHPLVADDWQRIVRFWDDTQPGGLLGHCLMGVSRSTGVALTLIYRGLHGLPNADAQSLNLLLEVRPIACPNELVLRKGLESFLELNEVEDLVRIWSRDARVVAKALRASANR